jgi:hypothetical protein
LLGGRGGGARNRAQSSLAGLVPDPRHTLTRIRRPPSPGLEAEAEAAAAQVERAKTASKDAAAAAKRAEESRGYVVNLDGSVTRLKLPDKDLRAKAIVYLSRIIRYLGDLPPRQVRTRTCACTSSPSPARLRTHVPVWALVTGSYCACLWVEACLFMGRAAGWADVRMRRVPCAQLPPLRTCVVCVALQVVAARSPAVGMSKYCTHGDVFGEVRGAVAVGCAAAWATGGGPTAAVHHLRWVGGGGRGCVACHGKVAACCTAVRSRAGRASGGGCEGGAGGGAEYGGRAAAGPCVEQPSRLRVRGARTRKRSHALAGVTP